MAQRLEGLRPALAARGRLKFQSVIFDVDGTLVGVYDDPADLLPNVNKFLGEDD